MKSLAVVLTHPAYYKIFPKVWENFKQIEVPNGIEIDYIAVTARDAVKPDWLTKYIEENKINLYLPKIDWSKYKRAGPKELVSEHTEFTDELSFRVVEQRNYYINLAEKGNYDYLFHIDGDILPPKDTLKNLLNANKNYIGGWAYNKKKRLICHFPNKNKYGIPYEVLMMGGYCILESKKCFKVKFSLRFHQPTFTDQHTRWPRLRRAGIKLYLHPKVFCEHLLFDGTAFTPEMLEE